MRNPKKFLLIASTLFCSLALSHATTPPSCNTTITANAQLLAELPDYTLLATYPLGTFPYGPWTTIIFHCEKGPWRPEWMGGYCQYLPIEKNMTIALSEVASGVYEYDLQFTLSPANPENDPFCSRILDHVTITTYQGQDNFQAFLIAAYKDQVLGILYNPNIPTFEADHSPQILFIQAPCDYWNNLVENNNTYKGQGRYPKCKNFTSNN